MSEGIDDRDEPKPGTNPFGWGPRPAMEQTDPLADLMGSPAPGSDDDPEVFATPEPESAESLAKEEELWDALAEASTEAPVQAAAAPAGAQPVAAAPQPSAANDSRKLQALRLLLVGNVVMIAAMLALPHPLETRPEYQPSTTTADPVVADGPAVVPAATPAPLAADARTPQLGLPDDARYEQALHQAMEGRFDQASRTLAAYLEAHPDLNPALQRLVHAHLAYYLQKAGRVSEAIVHENAMRALAGRASLPEELLQAARAAEQSGDGAAMRRAYAQFLLQREQLSPSMRALIQEAYLELGDAYRIDADGGQESPR